MSSASIEFPLRSKESAFGPISDPRISVAVHTSLGYRMYGFVVDTGADLSLASRSLAEEAGLDWDRLLPAQVRGVSGPGLAVRIGRLRLRIGVVQLTIRCLFADTSVAPRILGRADFLDRFILTFDQPRRNITLTEIP